MPFLIVEGQHKVKKIKSILGSDYVVMATLGHIMELEKQKMGIDLDNWTPVYKPNDDKIDVIKRLKEEGKKHDVIYVATDDDMEGHAISFNVREILPKKGCKIHRITFDEITATAINAAIKNPSKFNEDIYEAQQARRMTDRLIGFKVSPIMWAKGMKNTSAGRVQSAVLKWLVDREKEIRDFKSEEYWSIHADLIKDFTADFYGKSEEKIVPINEKEVLEIVKKIGGTLTVSKYDAKARNRSPEPPFITASLQAETNSKFGWSGQKTMELAQQLYGAGVISYHRTDSVRSSVEKVDEIRTKIKSKFGDKYLSETTRVYLNQDSAQDAHEAIRPTFEPAPVTLTVDERKLLELISARFMASQMSDAVFDQTLIELVSDKDSYLFKASGSILKFDGFLKVYGSASDDVMLPELKVKEKIKIKELRKIQHFTKPPARYSGAALVKKMKKEGVGRPSTYAVVPENLVDHGYITTDGKTLKPTEIGIMVSDYLAAFFKDITDAEFTAKLETELDKISEGKSEKKVVMNNFYQALLKELEDAKKGDPSSIFKTKIDCPTCKNGSKMTRKISANGLFLGCENYPTCGHAMNYDEDGNIVNNVVETGTPCPECNGRILQKKGKFGIWYACESYPACNWKGKVDENGNAVTKDTTATKLNKKCPNCKDGELIKRKGPYSYFAGCNNYPKCKTSFKLDDNDKLITEKPKSKSEQTGEKCPKCKTGSVVIRDGKFGKFKGCTDFKSGCKYMEKIK